MIDTTRIVCAARSIKPSSVRQSVCPIYRRRMPLRRVCCCGPRSRRYQSIAGAALGSECGQCHVDSRGTRLNRDCRNGDTLPTDTDYTYSAATFRHGQCKVIIIIIIYLFHIRDTQTIKTQNMNIGLRDNQAE